MANKAAFISHKLIWKSDSFFGQKFLVEWFLYASPQPFRDASKKIYPKGVVNRFCLINSSYWTTRSTT